MGKISVSFVSGTVSLWVTPEMAERLNKPQATFLNNGDIVITNEGNPRKWDTDKTSSPRVQLTGPSIKGRLPDREFSRTEAVSCVSKEAGKILLEMPAKRKPPIHRKRLNPAQKVPVVMARPTPMTITEAIEKLVDKPDLPRSERIKLAVETLNSVKEEFGDNFVLKIGEDGKVKATLLMEF